MSRGRQCLQTFRAPPVPCPCPCRPVHVVPGRAGPAPVDIGGRGRRATFFFQKNGKSFMRGHFKGPNENAVETFFDQASLPVIPVASDCRDTDFFFPTIFRGSDFQNGRDAHRIWGPTSKMGATPTEMGGRPAGVNKNHPIHAPTSLGGPGGPWGALGGRWGALGAGPGPWPWPCGLY